MATLRLISTLLVLLAGSLGPSLLAVEEAAIRQVADEVESKLADGSSVDQTEEKDPPGSRDQVHLRNGHVISGRVIATAADGAVLVERGAGQMVIEGRLIDHVLPSFTSRLAALEPDDYEGHLALAKWATHHNRLADARNLIGRFADSDQLDLEGLGLLAWLTDLDKEDGGPLTALPYYQRYAREGGQEARYLQRLAVIESKKAAFEAAHAQWQQQIDDIEVHEGLEAEQGWQAELEQYANPLTAQVGLLPNEHKNKGLFIQVGGGGQYKGSVRLASRHDRSRDPLVSFQVRNGSDRALPISIAVKTGDSWNYYESVAKTVPADEGWHELQFNLLDQTFKCHKDNYKKHSFAAGDIHDLREFQIQVHNGQEAAELWVDRIHFLPKP